MASYQAMVDELRTWPTERLVAGRGEAVVEERRWRLRRVAFDRVLDERGAMGGQEAAEFVQTARPGAVLDRPG